MGNQAWTAEVVAVFFKQIFALLRSNGCIVRALNEPVQAMAKEEILKALGYEAAEVPPPRVWRAVRVLAAKQNCYLIGDGRGWFIGTKEHAAKHKGARVSESITRLKNVGEWLAATPRDRLHEQQTYLDSTDKGTVVRRFVRVLEAAGSEENAQTILAALPAPRG